MGYQGEREWQLLIDCCLLNGDELPARAEQELHRTGFSVPHFVALARHHKLHLLVGRVFSGLDRKRLRGDTLETAYRLLPELQRLHAFRAGLMTAAAVELCERMPAGVPVAVTKGVALQHTVYGDDGTRYYGDLDIMVRPSDLDAVSATLDDLGYQARAYDEQSATLVPTRVGLRMATRLSKDHLPKRVRLTGQRGTPVVELDTAYSLTWGDAPWTVPLDEVLARTAVVNTDEGSLTTLLPGYQFLFVVLHLFREAWFEPSINALMTASKSVRLAQFRDVVRTWRALTPEEQDEVRQLTARHGLGDLVAWVATHTDRVLGTRIRTELGLAEPEEQWLSSASVSRRGSSFDTAGWQGTMTSRLRARHIEMAPRPDAAPTGPATPRIGVSLAPPDIRDIADFAAWAERIGIDSLSFGEGRMRRDAVVPMTLAASSTSRVTLASGVIPMRTRNVALLATTFKTLHQLAPGRIRLGLGAWWEPIASRVGLPTASPLTAMREIITALRELFEGRTVTVDGRYVHLDDVRFDAPEDDVAPRYDIPLLVGAVGDRMLRLAGELADGVVLDFWVPPAYTTRACERLREGAEVTGRSLDGFRRTQLIACSVDDADPEQAVWQCRVILARYLAQQPHIGAASGADPELVERLRKVVGWPATEEQIREAAHLVPVDLVRSVAACGTTDQVMESIQGYLDAGCGEPILVPYGNRAGTVESIVKRRAELRLPTSGAMGG